MPSTQKVLSLAAEVKTLEKDKEHLRINLNRAEEEVRRVVNLFAKMWMHWTPCSQSSNLRCI